MSNPRPFPRLRVAALTLAALASSGAGPDRLHAQSTAAAPKVFHACYVPSSGTVYRIKEPGLPDACLTTKGGNAHVEFSWTDGGAAVRSGDAAGGDLSGTYPNPAVTKIQGTSISGTSPSNGQVLTYDGASWSPTTPLASGTAGGDLTGSYPNPTVTRIQGQAVSSTPPRYPGQVLAWDGAAWKPLNPQPRPRVLLYGSSKSVGKTSSESYSMGCPQGTFIGGGVETSGGDMKVRESYPFSERWHATVRNDHAFNSGEMEVVAMCLVYYP